jgi:hypothetical protein
MAVVRNLVFMTSSAAVVSFGLIAAVLITQPTSNPGAPTGNQGNNNNTGGTGGTGTNNNNSATTPALPAGSQLAQGVANNVTAPNATGFTSPVSDTYGAIQTSATAGLPTDYAAGYAATSATLLQANLEGLRNMGGEPPLTYDPVLGQAAANLIADAVASGPGLPTQSTAVNSKGLTPIQQVKALAPNSKASSVAVLSYGSDALTQIEAQDPQTGLNPAEKSFTTDSNQIPFNTGWTHYGFAVVTVPAVSGQHNALRYYVVFFAKEN